MTAGITRECLTRLQTTSLDASCLGLSSLMPRSCISIWNPGRLLNPSDARIARLVQGIFAHHDIISRADIAGLVKLQNYPHLPFPYQRQLFSLILRVSVQSPDSEPRLDAAVLERIERISSSVIDPAKATFLQIISRFRAEEHTEENYLSISLLLKNVHRPEHLLQIQNEVCRFLDTNTAGNLRYVIALVDGISDPTYRAYMISRFQIQFPEHALVMIPHLHDLIHAIDHADARLAFIHLIALIPEEDRSAEIISRLASSFNKLEERARNKSALVSIYGHLLGLFRTGKHQNFFAVIDIFDRIKDLSFLPVFIEMLDSIDSFTPAALYFFNTAEFTVLDHGELLASLVSNVNLFSKTSVDEAFLIRVFNLFRDLPSSFESRYLSSQLQMIPKSQIPIFLENCSGSINELSGMSKGFLVHSLRRLFDSSVHAPSFTISSEQICSLIYYCSSVNYPPHLEGVIAKLLELDEPKRWACIGMLGNLALNRHERSNHFYEQISRCITLAPPATSEKILRMYWERRRRLTSPETTKFFIECMFHFASVDPDFGFADQILRFADRAHYLELDKIKKFFLHQPKEQALRMMSVVNSTRSELSASNMRWTLYTLSELPESQRDTKAVENADLIYSGIASEEEKNAVKTLIEARLISERRQALHIIGEIFPSLPHKCNRMALLRFAPTLPSYLTTPAVLKNIRNLFRLIDADMHDKALELLPFMDPERISSLIRIFSEHKPYYLVYNPIEIMHATLCLKKDSVTAGRVFSLLALMCERDLVSNAFKKSLSESFFLVPEENKEEALSLLNEVIASHFSGLGDLFTVLRKKIPDLCDQIYDSQSFDLSGPDLNLALLKAIAIRTHVPETDEEAAVIRDIAARVEHYASAESRDETKNPYTLYRQLEETQDAPIVLPPLSFEDIDGRKIAFSIAQHVEQSRLFSMAERGRDLPSIHPFGVLREIFSSLEARIAALPTEQQLEVEEAVKEYVNYSDRSYDQAMNFIDFNIFSDPYLQSLAHSSIADDEVVPYDMYHFFKIVENISRQSSTLGGGSLFSDQEESFLKFTATVRECSTGKKEALHRLFHTSGLSRTPSALSAEDQIKQVLHTFFIGYISELISESGPCLFSLCGTAGLREVSHQALYIKNNLGKFLGLDHNMKFDFFSYNVEDYLAVMPKDRMLEVLNSHIRPSSLLARLEAHIKEKINPKPGALPKEIREANIFRNRLATIFSAEGVFVFDESTEPAEVRMTKLGLIGMLSHFGYFVISE